MSKKQWYLVSVLHRFYNESDKMVLAEYLNNGWEPFGASDHLTLLNEPGLYYHLRKRA